MKWRNRDRAIARKTRAVTRPKIGGVRIVIDAKPLFAPIFTLEEFRDIEGFTWDDVYCDETREPVRMRIERLWDWDSTSTANDLAT